VDRRCTRRLPLARGARDGRVNRLFRMDPDGTIDRSSALPVGAAGAALQAEGAIAVTPDGTVWAVATDGTTTDIVHYAPS
jgi:hypothetical protein